MAPQGHQLQPVGVAEVDFGQGPSRQARAGFQGGLKQAEPVGLEGAQVGVRATLDLKFLEPAQHVQIPAASLDEQDVVAPERLAGLRHDGQVAVPEQGEETEIEGVPDAAALQRVAGKLGLPRTRTTKM